MARNMCFRSIVNICKYSIKPQKWQGLHLQSGQIMFNNPSYNDVCSNQHFAKFFSTSCTLQNNVSDEQLKKLMDKLGEKFTEARELLEDTRESEGTVYFSADLEDAQQAVTETLAEYNKLLDDISETQKQTVARTIGLRMGELKAQLDAINEKLTE